MTALAPSSTRTSAAGPALAGFFAVQMLLALLLFRDALWGGSLLAPLDLAPALMPELKFVDPNRTIPDNHYVFDQLVYDLPLQRTIYSALHRGEIPWWDPYTFGGRPLLADAHINGTDPVRMLCYLTLPFELAYNWTRVFHFMLAGGGMFLLLRRLGITAPLPFWLALAWEFAGCQVIKFGHPWVPASFAWYPWLWLAFHHAWTTGSRRAEAGIALTTGAIFYAGNLQSHAYVPLFLGALAAGYSGLDTAAWARTLRRLLPPVLLGACLAAPMLLNEIEFYRLNLRSADVGVPTRPWLAAVLSAAGMVHPWALGTFRTLDASKLAGLFGLGFRLFAGVVVLGGAALALARREDRGRLPSAARAGILMLAAYFAVLATPLVSLLYPRAAGLGVVGLVVLAAYGLERLRADPRPWRRSGRLLLAWTLALAVATNALAFLVWPAIRDRVAAQLARRAVESALGEAPALREQQLMAFPAEVSFANPEALLAVLGWLALAGLLLRPTWRTSAPVWHAVLALNLAPLLLFAGRYVPRHDLSLWHRLEAGSSTQQAVAAALNESGARLWESEPRVPRNLFPGTLGHLQQVRTLRGYSALHPRVIAELPEAERDRWLAELGDARYENGRFMPGTANGRFHWPAGGGQTPKFTQLGLNAFRLEFATPQAGTLWWTDTQYPGWSVRADGRELELQPQPPSFGRLTLTSPARVLDFRYRPTGLRLGLGLGLGAALILMLWLGWPRTIGADPRLAKLA